jgi:hypothetical protein
MKIVEFKKSSSVNINGEDIKIRPKHMYLFADTIWMTFKDRLLKVIKSSNVHMTNAQLKNIYNKVVKYEKNIDDVLEKLDFAKDNKMIFPIILRTGGIGDLIALSSISMNVVKFLNKKSINLKFISQEKYRSVFKWYREPITFVSYFSPIVRYDSNNFIEKRRINSRYKTIYYEGVIENSKNNWYELQYNTIGIGEFDTEWGRPHLKTTRINNNKSNISSDKLSILINPRSTAIIRSMRFQDIYESTIACIGEKDVNIYIHDLNLRAHDVKYIDNLNDDRVKIISAKNLDEFFLDAYDATLTISVDTALLHFREGVEKPAIGLYGPFPFECRSKYYKYTKSLNIRSDCENAPCFIHVKSADSICDFQKSLHDNDNYDIEYRDYAPCCCNEWNSTVQQQIIDNFKGYIIDNLSSG